MSILRQFCVNFFRFDAKAAWMLFILLTLAAILEGAGLMLLIPLLQLALPDQGGANKETLHGVLQYLPDFNNIFPVLILFVLIMLVQTSVRYCADVNSSSLRLRFLDHLRQRLFNSIAEADWRYLVQRNHSEFVNVLTTDLGRVAAGVYGVLQLLVSVTLALIYVVLSMGLSWPLTLAALLCGLLLALSMRKQNQRSAQAGKQLTQANAALQHTLQDYLACLKTIKSHHQEAQHKAHFSDNLSQIYGQQQDFARHHALSQSGFKLGAASCLCLLIYVSSMIPDLSSATILLLVVVFARLMPVLSGLLLNWQRLVFMLPAYEHYLELDESLSRHSNLSSSGPENIVFKNAVEFEQVSFSYYGDQPVIESMDLHIPKNKTTVIIGPSGIGKSTLIDLLTGLLQPVSGIVRIDDQQLTAGLRPAWQQKIAYVGQDPVLFNDSIRNNLCWMYPAASDAQIADALHAAAADFVYSLAAGVDTQVGDRGARLSGGERQRLALARALMGQPELLILDEVTSALDDLNRNIILAALAKMAGSLTLVIVTHQHQYLALADEIIDLKPPRAQMAEPAP